MNILPVLNNLLINLKKYFLWNDETAAGPRGAKTNLDWSPETSSAWKDLEPFVQMVFFINLYITRNFELINYYFTFLWLV